MEMGTSCIAELYRGEEMSILRNVSAKRVALAKLPLGADYCRPIFDSDPFETRPIGLGLPKDVWEFAWNREADSKAWQEAV